MAKRFKMNGIDFAQFGFFVWLFCTYGIFIKGTYKEIAKLTNSLSYGTVRNYLLALEKANYLQVKNKGKWHQIYSLNVNMVNLIFGNGHQ